MIGFLLFIWVMGYIAYKGYKAYPKAKLEESNNSDIPRRYRRGGDTFPAN